MSEEEQEKLYELLFKDTKNKLEKTIEKLRIVNAELRDELDKKNSEIEKQQKEIEEYKKEKEKEKNKTVRDRIEYYLLDNMSLENNPEKLRKELIKLKELLEE